MEGGEGSVTRRAEVEVYLQRITHCFRILNSWHVFNTIESLIQFFFPRHKKIFAKA